MFFSSCIFHFRQKQVFIEEELNLLLYLFCEMVTKKNSETLESRVVHTYFQIR